MHFIRTSHGVAIARSDSSILPIPQILGIGRNYAQHAREQGAAIPTLPMVFSKNPACACLHHDPILVPPACQDPATSYPEGQVDYEGELAVVIAPRPDARPCRDVSKSDAHSFVLGYTIANDVSARWWQKIGGQSQFFRAKSFDSFCPLGPSITPSSLVPNPHNLLITTRVNHELRQNASTSDMIFDIPTLIAFLSQGTTLLPGTIILTGTPSGVGMGFNPPRYLQHNDTVDVEIQSLGCLSNPVKFL